MPSELDDDACEEVQPKSVTISELEGDFANKCLFHDSVFQIVIKHGGFSQILPTKSVKDLNWYLSYPITLETGEKITFEVSEFRHCQEDTILRKEKGSFKYNDLNRQEYVTIPNMGGIKVIFSEQ